MRSSNPPGATRSRGRLRRWSFWGPLCLVVVAECLVIARCVMIGWSRRSSDDGSKVYYIVGHASVSVFGGGPIPLSPWQFVAVFSALCVAVTVVIALLARRLYRSVASGRRGRLPT